MKQLSCKFFTVLHSWNVEHVENWLSHDNDKLVLCWISFLLISVIVAVCSWGLHNLLLTKQIDEFLWTQCNPYSVLLSLFLVNCSPINQFAQKLSIYILSTNKCRESSRLGSLLCVHKRSVSLLIRPILQYFNIQTPLIITHYWATCQHLACL